MSITAKVRVEGKTAGTAGEGTALVTFAPDYQDGRNREWSAATPHLSLVMTLNGDVADRFEIGQRYTLSFDPTE